MCFHGQRRLQVEAGGVDVEYGRHGRLYLTLLWLSGESQLEVWLPRLEPQEFRRVLPRQIIRNRGRTLPALNRSADSVCLFHMQANAVWIRNRYPACMRRGMRNGQWWYDPRFPGFDGHDPVE